MCNRALQFQKFAQNGVAPPLWLEREREPAQLRTRHPRTLRGLGPEILTDAMPDCGPQPGGTSPTLRSSVIAVKPSGRGGVGMVSPQPNIWQKYPKIDVNMSSLTSYQKFKKIWKIFLQEKVFF